MAVLAAQKGPRIEFSPGVFCYTPYPRLFSAMGGFSRHGDWETGKGVCGSLP